ncbi:MAG: hypothetical protein RLY31_1368 [Bacteroidota bacterium]|jgi:threonine/homoserine/homoserine lactone efflux protein
MINMMVAQTAIRKGLRYAVWAAFGAASVEFFQVFIAIKFTWLFTDHPGVERIFQWIAATAFLLAGGYFLFFARPPGGLPEGEPPGRRRNEFFKGVLVSSLNLMVIPFWIFYGTLLAANGWLVRENSYVLSFSTGTLAGTFTLLVGYALLGEKILGRSAVITKWVNKFIGTALLLFAIFQLYKLR